MQGYCGGLLFLAEMTDSKKASCLRRVSSPRLLTRAGLSTVSLAALFLPRRALSTASGEAAGLESWAEGSLSLAEAWGPTSLQNIGPPSLLVHKNPGKGHSDLFFPHHFAVTLIGMHYSSPAWKRYCSGLCSAVSIRQRGLLALIGFQMPCSSGPGRLP